MLYRFLADFVLVFHIAFVFFAVLGSLLVLRWPRVAWVHVPVVIWGATVELTSLICPLTPLENHLRRLAGQARYRGGFIEHYILPVLYPAGLTRSIQVALGIFVFLLNVSVYTAIWQRRSRGR